MKFLGTDLSRDIKRDMFDYMPKEYEDYAESNAIITSEAKEFEKLNADISDVLNQFYIDTATWGLAAWEYICGIPTDETKPIDQRRSFIKTRLRGMGTVTVELIKNVVESYVYGDVDVIEDNPNYTITIKFVSTYGVPNNLHDIEEALRDIIPAHLAINYSFKFASYAQLTTLYANYGAIVTANKTYDDILNNR